MTTPRPLLAALALTAWPMTPALAQASFAPRETIGSVWGDRCVAIVDLDGDGDRDLLTATNSFLNQEYRLRFIERLADGMTAPPVQIAAGPSTSAPASVTAQDLDGDGLVDVIVSTETGAVQIHDGLPGGQLAPPRVLVPGVARVWDFEVADVDADGDLDLVYADELANALVLLRKTPAGYAPEQLHAGLDACRDLAFLDVDGDGDQDLVALDVQQDSVLLLRADQGGFGAAEVIASGLDAPERVRVGDLSGDALPDLVLTASNDDSVVVLENSQLGTVWSMTAIDTNLRYPIALRVGDINDDGLLDVMAAPSAGEDPAIYFADGNGGYLKQVVDFGPVNARVNFELEDYDQDGDVDVLLWLAFDQSVVYQVPQSTPFGTRFCTPATNSTGFPASLSGSGSHQVALNDLRLRASLVPPNTFGIFATSRATRAPFVPLGGAGNFCLGDATGAGVGRLDGPGQVLGSGPSGELVLTVDLAMMPSDAAFVAATAGETWSFQAWFRDQAMGAPSFNFSEGLMVTLR